MKTYKGSSCDELKLQLIQKIIESDCSVLNAISATEKSSNWRAMFSREITEEQKNAEVLTLQENFQALNSPATFKVKGFEDVLKTHIFDTDYMHLYFVKDDNGINLLFRFNSLDECSKNKTQGTDSLYILDDTNLKPISFDEGKVLMDRFVDDFNKDYSRDAGKKITEYITHSLGTVRQNFYRFEEDTELIIGAKPDGDALRMNIILSIPKADCKNATTTGLTAFYNLGNLKP